MRNSHLVILDTVVGIDRWCKLLTNDIIRATSEGLQRQTKTLCSHRVADLNLGFVRKGIGDAGEFVARYGTKSRLASARADLLC